jgi:hypothetical protein
MMNASDIDNAAKHKLRKTWGAMKSRCEYTKSPSWANYGGRGIKIEWISFDDFSFDMLQSLKLHIQKNNMDVSIERFNSNGNYCKENCGWETKSGQARNRRSNRYLTFDGETKLLVEWAEERKLPMSVLWNRLNRGWSVEKTLSTPQIRQRKKYLIDGNQLTLTEASTKYGIPFHRLYDRIEMRNWPVSKAITTSKKVNQYDSGK